MISNRQRGVKIPRKHLELFLARVRRELRLGHAEISIAMVTDAEISRLNKLYRRKSGPTDVLSFPATRHSPLATRHSPLFLGDIAIAPAVAQKYARRNGRTLSRELRVLLLHGMLHLLGYDHETDHGQMDRIEQKLRRRLGLS